MGIRKWNIAVWPALLALVSSLVFGYGNDGPGGGPHRRLNALALSRFIQMAAQDPILKHYDFRPTVERYGLPAASGLFHVKFQTVTQSGSWYRHMSLWPGVTSSFIEEGDVSAPFAWWVEEGGYTADEPESFMAMRHFYDPLAQSLDSETGKRVSYLTDELDPWVSPILMGHNPRMDAKTWAVKESPYSFYWGQTGLLYIDELPIVHEDRGREFGKVWRTLGESLHLLADMTVPAHVRNDSHPGPWILNYLTIKKTLKGDPYEDYVDADVVSACAAGPAPEAVRSSLRDVRDPGVLMHSLALFTNQFFFSKDTISGKDGVTGQPVEPANGAAAYPAPKLEFYRFEPASGGAGFYQTPNGFFDAATRTRDGLHTVSAPTVTGQALALIPAAVEAEVKLIDLFMPRVRVFIDGFEKETGRLRFHAVRIQADKSGAYLADGRPTKLWSSPDAVVLLSVGGVRRTAAVRIEAGPGLGLSLDLSREIDAARVEAAATEKPVETSCVVGLDMGGILVRSEPIKIVLAPPAIEQDVRKPEKPEPEQGSATSATASTSSAVKTMDPQSFDRMLKQRYDELRQLCDEISEIWNKKQDCCSNQSHYGTPLDGMAALVSVQKFAQCQLGCRNCGMTFSTRGSKRPNGKTYYEHYRERVEYYDKLLQQAPPDFWKTHEYEEYGGLNIIKKK